MSRKNKTGPMITIAGTQLRALSTEVLMRDPGAQGEEIIFWREQHAQAEQATSRMAAELDRAEATVRNLDVELRRLRARVKELESGPADGSRTRIGLIESQVS